jgi:hypothetical protein
MGAPCCMSGMLRIPGMSCMPPGCPGCPGWGCIIAMFRQHGHIPPADWPGCAGWAVWPGCWAWAAAVGVPHIIGLAAAVEPVVWAAAWCIGQARAGVAAKPAAAAMARVSFLMACPSGTDPARFAPFAVLGNSQCGERPRLKSTRDRSDRARTLVAPEGRPACRAELDDRVVVRHHSRHLDARRSG